MDRQFVTLNISYTVTQLRPNETSDGKRPMDTSDEQISSFVRFLMLYNQMCAI